MRLPATPFRHRAPRWLILADDLTGAADCAVAFAGVGHAATVSWGDADDAGTAVSAIDVDSRRLAPEAAAERHRALVASRCAPGTALFKKIDSTLRGQPVAELATTLAALREARRPALAVVAPAFPAAGRTTGGGRVRVDGRPLEESVLWARDRSYPHADLVALLDDAGLPAGLLPLAVLRAGGGGAAMRGARDAGAAALVCDAAEAADLAAIVAAGLPMADRLVWVGTGGLAAALAAACPAAPEPDRPRPCLPPGGAAPGGRGGVLVVVGSAAEASRAGAAALAEAGAADIFTVPPALLRGRGDGGRECLSGAIAAALLGGRDAVVSLGRDADGLDLSRGAALARELAALLRPAGRAMGALFVTGGETARALLDALGVRGLLMIGEVEPGVPVALARGALAVPVVTKAGGFGGAGTIVRAHRLLRAMLQEREVS